MQSLYNFKLAILVKIYVLVLSALVILFLYKTATAQTPQPATSTETINTATEPTADATSSEAFITLKQKIEQKNQEIELLEQEITKYKEELTKNTATQKTLQSELKTLDITQKKLTTDISLTTKRIDATELSIEELTSNIIDKQKSINIQQRAIREAIIKKYENDQVSLVENLLGHEKLSEFWSNQSEMVELQKNMQARVQTLLSVKTELTNAKNESEKKFKDLSRLKSQLSDQKKIVDVNKTAKNSILSDTKNKESEYKKQLAEREARRLAVEKELLDYESELRFLIDPTSYPTAGTKSLFPPLDEIFVTQQFGDTEFSRKNAGLYNGKGHNGVDFRASVGTPVKSAFAGIVQGAGNTDLVCPGASYGRWILIKHGNGLTTLYAHLSLIKVNEGDMVETGDLIGYTGNTGYTTGPHLHFGLFATQGVRITNLKSRVCNGTYRVPVADFRAYLNPMSYI